MHNITLIKGDGIGPEITDAVVKIIKAAGVDIVWDIQTAGADVIKKEGVPLPQRVIDSVKRNKIALKSPVTTPIGKGFRSVLKIIEKKFVLLQKQISASFLTDYFWIVPEKLRKNIQTSVSEKFWLIIAVCN